MDKFSYGLGLGIGQQLLSMGAEVNVDDFAQAVATTEQTEAALDAALPKADGEPTESAAEDAAQAAESVDGRTGEQEVDS